MYDVTVWITEGLLAFFFLGAGLPKVLGRGIDRWVGFDQIPRALTILIGISEVAAAIALVVPLLVDVSQWTTPLAALGVAVISLMASGFHLRNRESLAALESALWASLATSVAVARWDEFAGGPSISREDVLLPLMIVLVPATIINLVFLTRATTPEAADAPPQLAETDRRR